MAEFKDPRRLIGELMDALEHQKSVTEDLTNELKILGNTVEVLEMLKDYAQNLNVQSESLEKIARTTETAYENDLYKRMVAK